MATYSLQTGSGLWNNWIWHVEQGLHHHSVVGSFACDLPQPGDWAMRHFTHVTVWLSSGEKQLWGEATLAGSYHWHALDLSWIIPACHLKTLLTPTLREINRELWVSHHLQLLFQAACGLSRHVTQFILFTFRKLS